MDGAMVDAAMLRQAERILALPYEVEAETTAQPTHRVAAPYYDELARGAVFTAPGLTLTEGHAALHQSKPATVCGSRSTRGCTRR